MKLLFDCDGTILDSMHIWHSPYDVLMEKYHFVPTKEQKEFIEGLSLQQTCDFFAEHITKDMTSSEVKDYLEQILSHGYQETLQPKKGAVDILRKLHAEGYEMAIASSTDFHYLKSALTRLQLDSLFQFYLTPDQFGLMKSESTYWKKACELFETEASDILLFDDAVYALRAAGKIGIQTVGLKDFPYNESQWEEIEQTADFLLDSIADIQIEKLK